MAQPGVSIVQGSRNSNNWARILLYDVLERAQARIPWVYPYQWVDDINLLAIGTQKLIELHSPNATLELLTGLRNKGLRISSKSQIVSSRPVLAKRRASLLELEGEILKVATVGKDLGIDFSGGRTHRRLFHHKRARTAIQRIRRIRFIKKHKGPALKMTTAGFLPSISYGPSVLGVSSYEIKRMRREMCASALVHRAGRCPYTVSSIVYNRKDPLIAVGLSQLKTWWGAWTSSDDFRRRIQRAWPRIQPHIRNAPSNRRWRRTHGPIGGIIATLTDHGWEAPSPDRWTSPGGTAFNLSDPALLSDPSPLFSHFEATLWHDFWLAADNGYCGTGLAGGCDMTVLRRQWNTLYESDTQAAGMLLNAVAGGNWVGARKHAARLVEDTLCARCGLADETEAHRLWECEHNKSLDLPPMPPAVSTYGDAESCPALWIRGLVPGKFLHYFPAPEETPLFGCKEAATDDVITPRQGEHLLVGFGDASGGRYATDTRYRRVGTAAIIMDFPGNDWTDIEDLSVQQFIDATSPTLLCSEEDPTSSPIEPLSLRLHEAFSMRAGWMQVLPGAPQTTPRGELWAFILALSHTRGPLLYFADYMGLVIGFREKRYLFPSGPLEKLWSRIGLLVAGRGSSVEVRHVDSHATAEDVVEGRAKLPLVLGNSMADALARMSADSLECDEGQVLLDTHLEQLATSIRKRAHLVNLAAHQVEPSERAPREAVHQPRSKAGTKRQRLLQETSHTLTKSDNHYHCESCHATVSQDRLNAWLQRGPCPAMLDVPTPVAIGSGALHESHTLTFLDDRRTWLCTACGHVSRLRALKLGQPCPRVLSKAGRRNLIAIQNGKKLD